MTAVKITGTITPTAESDTFPTHLAKHAKGGHRTVATLLERNGIASERLEEGMLVYVVETQTYYKLNSDLSTWSDFISTNWTQNDW